MASSRKIACPPEQRLSAGTAVQVSFSRVGRAVQGELSLYCTSSPLGFRVCDVRRRQMRWNFVTKDFYLLFELSIF